MSSFVLLLFDDGIHRRLYSRAYCLTDAAESRIRDFLSDDIPVVSYTEIEVARLMLVENRGNGNDTVLDFSGALLELNLFCLLSDVDYPAQGNPP